MFDLFGKLWLKGVKRLIKAQAAQSASQRKLQAGVRKATGKAVAKTAKSVGKSVAKAVSQSTQSAQPARRAAKKSTDRSKNPAAATGGAGFGAPTALALDAGGSWRQTYQSSASTLGSTRSRRLGGWLFLPTQPETAAGGMPLVVMLHGCQQTAAAFATGTRMNQLGARHGFAVLYPQQSASAHPQRCWPWYRRTLQQGGDELALIAAMIERTCARHRLDARRVYVAGLSAGAALAHNLALRRPDLVAAVALHSGPVHGAADSRMSAFAVMQQGTRDALQPIARLQREQGSRTDMPSLIIQGERDQVVRPVNATQLFSQCCAVNAIDAADAATPRSVAQRPGCDAYRVTDARRGSRTLVRLVEVAHLDHAWSGGDDALRYNAAQGPDASAMLWAFFRQHGRRQPDAIDAPSPLDTTA